MDNHRVLEQTTHRFQKNGIMKRPMMKSIIKFLQENDFAIALIRQALANPETIKAHMTATAVELLLLLDGE